MPSHPAAPAVFGQGIPAVPGEPERKSSYSSNGGANRVEVAGSLSGIVGVRDSKDPGGPILMISRDEWASFIAHIRSTAAAG